MFNIMVWIIYILYFKRFNIKCGNDNPEIICFYWNTMNCELCKSPIRRNIKVEEEEFDLVNLSKP